MLSELLRALGHYNLPEAQVDEIVADEPEIDRAFRRLVSLLADFGRVALSGDRDLFRRLDAQRDLDCL